MENNGRNHNESIISLFNQNFRWWQDVYRDDLPRGFFSFEMRRRLEWVAALLRAQIETMENPDVLECGCGPGDILELLAPSGCKLTGLDLNQRYLDLAAEKVPQATLMAGNVEELPFADGAFDIVYAVGVFQYLDDDHAAAREICRVTREGGVILISFANYRMLHLLLDPYYLFRLFKKILRIKEQPSQGESDETRIRRYTLTQLKKMFREHNVHEIESRATSYGPFKFWRREVLPLATSIRISDLLLKGSGKSLFSGLKHVGNHLTITLRKGAVPDGTSRIEI